MTIGARIKKRREELGLTQTDLAIRMGYKSRAAICNVEKDKEDLTTARIRKYAEALDCSPAYLMGWQEQVLQLQQFAENVSQQTKPITDKFKELSKVLSNQYGSSKNETDIMAEIESLASQYDATQLEKALRFTKAFLNATPEQQKIALEILQLHREES